MATEISILVLKLRNTFSEHYTNMNGPAQQSIFEEMGVDFFHIEQFIGAPKRATVIFKGSEMFYITFSPGRKKAYCNICEGTKITRRKNNSTNYSLFVW